MDWKDFLSAIALVMVIEGLPPFANPRGTKRTMSLLAQLPDDRLRLAGLVSMLAGLVVLWFVRS
jgi:hypothetical protein